MGFYKQRAATTITASLIQWRLRGDSAVEGTVYGSVSDEYRNGEKRIFMFGKLTHYRQAEGFWPDHFIYSTNTGRHFYLYSGEQLHEASLA